MDYQESLISDAVAGMDCFQEGNIIEPENAEIKLGDDGYYVEPEEPGKKNAHRHKYYKCLPVPGHIFRLQHLWYYESGSLVTETDVVTGNISRDNGSPDGVFKIVYKESPAVLKGEDYESADFFTCQFFIVILNFICNFCIFITLDALHGICNYRALFCNFRVWGTMDITLSRRNRAPAWCLKMSLQK